MEEKLGAECQISLMWREKDATEKTDIKNVCGEDAGRKLV